MSEMLALEGRRTWREIADELLETQRVEYVDEGGLIFVPPAGRRHMYIIRWLNYAFYNGPWPEGHSEPWEVGSENFQWDFPDGSEHFYIPDLAVAYPTSTFDPEEFRENIVLLVEVTSPKSTESTANDRTAKPNQYARGGVPFYLLVDREKASWTLHELIKDWPKYRVHSSGSFGDPIDLPEPFGFSIPTDKWPPYSPDGE